MPLKNSFEGPTIQILLLNAIYYNYHIIFILS
jgi:hypothetical protein